MDNIQNDSLKIRCRGDDGYRAITLRIPVATLGTIDKIARTANYSRNEILTMLIDYGIEHVEILPMKDQEV